MNTLAHKVETLFLMIKGHQKVEDDSLSTGSNFNLLLTMVSLKGQLEKVAQGISKDVQTYPERPYLRFLVAFHLKT
jgi:hypothetical protein